MARRKPSALEDLSRIAAVIPWWAALAVAIAAWFGFGLLIAADRNSVTDESDIGQAAAQGMRVMLYSIARYVIPIAFLCGAMLSLAGRRHRSGLLRKARAIPDTIENLSWRDFELLVSEAFRARGYQISERGGRGADGGIDIELRKNGERFLVQCKHWKARSVGVGVVRELFGVTAAEGAAGGIVICSGTFTPDAEKFAEATTIELIGANELTRLLHDGAHALPATSSMETEALAQQATPTCPDCGRSMVKRTARKGPSIGVSFWGCERFPQCRGTRSF